MGKLFDAFGLVALGFLIGAVAVEEQVDPFTAVWLLIQAIATGFYGALEILAGWVELIAREGW